MSDRRPPAFDYFDEAWMTESACIGHDPAIWFATDGEVEARRQAVAICNTCPVRLPCLNYALRSDTKFGIWGGLSANKRDQMTKQGVRDVAC